MANKEKEPAKPQEDQPAEQYVQITQTQFAELMAKVDMLEQIADKGRLASFQERTKKPFAMVVKLRTLTDQDGRHVIMSWRSTKDLVWKENGVWKEDQQTEVLLENGKKENMPLADFWALTSDRMTAEVTKREVVELPTGGQIVTLTLSCEDGKERVINEQFVN